MASLDLGNVISRSFDDYKSNFITHFIASILTAIVSGLAFGLLLGPMQVGYMKMQDKLRSGQAIEIGDVFKGFDHFAPALVVWLVGGILVGIGFILCVIPGFLLLPILPVAFHLVGRGEKDGIQALKRAWRLVYANLVMSAITMLILAVIGSLGAILCGIGVFLTLPLLYIGSYHFAQQLTAGESTPTLLTSS